MERIDEKLIPSYVAIDADGLADRMNEHPIQLDISSEHPTIGEVVEVSELRLPVAQSEGRPKDYLLEIRVLSSLKYSGTKSDLYFSFVELAGLKAGHKIVLGTESISLNDREIWLGAQHANGSNQISFTCGNKVVGIMGMQSNEQLIALIENLLIEQQTGCM